jgi:hypothetical protein
LSGQPDSGPLKQLRLEGHHYPGILGEILGFRGFFVGLLHFLRSLAMSILDRLTDDGLKALVEVKNVEIAHLQDRIKFLEEERARLEKWSKARRHLGSSWNSR